MTALSAPPVTRAVWGKGVCALPEESQDGILFHYLPAVFVPGIKHILVWLFSFFYTLFHLDGNTFVLCNGLTLSVSEGARMAARLRRRPCAAFVTDVPEILGSGLTARLMKRQLAKYDGYLLLTAPMDPLVNPHHRPSLVMEGMVDARLKDANPGAVPKSPHKVCMYAGMLYGLYGVDKLVRAFMKTQDPEARLVLYGGGDAVEMIQKAAGEDGRIVYRGQATNEEIVAREAEATLLINPRPTKDAYTAYSFPSKNLEYMASGTPVVTTKLAGMPEAYLPYVYLFTDEGEEGMTKTLDALLALDGATLKEKGAGARAFVMREKTNVSQAGRILAWMKGI